MSGINAFWDYGCWLGGRCRTVGWSPDCLSCACTLLALAQGVRLSQRNSYLALLCLLCYGGSADGVERGVGVNAIFTRGVTAPPPGPNVAAGQRACRGAEKAGESLLTI